MGGSDGGPAPERASDPSLARCTGLGRILGVGIVAPGAVLGAHEPSGGPNSDGPTISCNVDVEGAGREGVGMGMGTDGGGAGW